MKENGIIVFYNFTRKEKEIWSKPQCPFCDMAENLCIQKRF